MNADYKVVPARFGPETRFEVTPVPAAPFRAVRDTELERLKNRLLGRYLSELPEPGANSYVRRAANDAAALAWTTAFPLLVFPVLFEEIARTALLQADRQETVWRRSEQLLAV